MLKQESLIFRLTVKRKVRRYACPLTNSGLVQVLEVRSQPWAKPSPPPERPNPRALMIQVSERNTPLHLMDIGKPITKGVKATYGGPKQTVKGSKFGLDCSPFISANSKYLSLPLEPITLDCSFSKLCIE